MTSVAVNRVQTSIHPDSVLLDIFLEVLDHMAGLLLILGATILFFIAIVPFYIPTEFSTSKHHFISIPSPRSQRTEKREVGEERVLGLQEDNEI